MATISDMIKIQLGLETAEFNKSLQKSKENIQKTSSELAKGADQVAGKAIGQIAGIARMVAAPLAGAMSIGSMIKSYFGGVAQVAQMTGAYSPKLDEWRKKRALLNRVTAEDIQLYKKSREALTKFQITMADLSAKIMRQTSPAVKFLAEMLTKVSDWVDAHSDDIVRFITIVASLIGTALIPRLTKMAVAMVMNPITWIVAALIGLAAVIDDLIVWLEGGESALGDFWSMFGSREEVLAKIQTAIKLTVATLEAMWESLKAGVKAAVDWFGEFWSSCNGTERVVGTLKDVFHSVVQTVKDVIAIWDALVDSMEKTGFLDDLANAFDGVLSFILGAFKLFFSALQAIFGLIKGLLTGDWGSFKEAVSKAVESAEEAFSGLLKIIGSVLNQLWELSKEIFGRIGSSLTEVILSAVEGAKNTLSSLFESVGDIVNQVEEQIKETLTGIGDSIKSSISDAIDGIKSAFTGLLDTVKAVLTQIWEAAKEIFGRIGTALKEALTPDLEKWGEKLNPMNWFKSDAPEVRDEGLQAERGTESMNADNRSTTIDSHANVTINTNSPAVAQAAVEQASPGSSSSYTDQSALAVS